MIALIGGVMVDGAIRRDVELAAPDGAGELRLAEIAAADLPQPDRVSACLAEMVARVGGRSLDRAGAAALSVGDRQHLARAVGIRLGRDLVWLTSRCSACQAPFDIPVLQSDLPVKAAGPGYPETSHRIGGAHVRLRAPTGADQAAVAGLPETAAVEALFARLIDCPDGTELADADRAALEAAIEAMAPEVALEAETDCPDCGAQNRVAVDPYLGLGMTGTEIFDDIHVLASRYHWSQREILSLPRARRKRYLSLIDRERGRAGRDAPGPMH